MANTNASTDDMVNTVPCDHVQPLADRIKSVFDDALAALIARRDQRYADETRALDAEREALVKEHATIGEAAENLRELLPAKEREAHRAADVLLLEGKREEAEAKLTEAQQAADAPAAMNERQREISARLEAIDSEKRTIAKQVYEEWFAGVQPFVRAAEHGLFITLLEGLEASSYQFQECTNTGASNNPYRRPLVHPGYFAGLTADERSLEWQAGTKWYGGRR